MMRTRKNRFRAANTKAKAIDFLADSVVGGIVLAVLTAFVLFMLVFFALDIG